MKNESEIIDAAHSAMSALLTAIENARSGDVAAVLAAIDRVEDRTAEMQEMVLNGDVEGAAEAGQ